MRFVAAGKRQVPLQINMVLRDGKIEASPASVAGYRVGTRLDQRIPYMTCLTRLDRASPPGYKMMETEGKTIG